MSTASVVSAANGKRARAAVMLELESRLLNLAVEARDAFGPGFGTEHRYKPCQLMRQSCVNSII